MKRNLGSELYYLVDELQGQGLTLSQARREFERQFIMASLRAHDGNVTRSARSLGVHRNTLHNKVSDLGISPTEAETKESLRR